MRRTKLSNRLCWRIKKKDCWNKTGFAEHKDACKNTETKEKFIQSEKKDTKLPCHIFMIGHSLDFENAEILCQETNWRKRKLLEALHIELPRMHVTSIKDTALTTTGGFISEIF